MGRHDTSNGTPHESQGGRRAHAQAYCRPGLAARHRWRQRLKEGSRRWFTIEGNKNIRRKGIRLWPLWRKDDLDLRASLHTIVPSRYRAKRQKILTLIRAKRATDGAAIDGAADVMALLDTPDRIRVEGDHDSGSAAGLGDNRHEALRSHALHLIDQRIEYATG